MRRALLIPAAAFIFAGCAATGEQHRTEVISRTLTSTVQLFSLRGDDVRRAGSGVVLGPGHEPGQVLILTTRHLLVPMMEQTVLVVDPLRRRQVAAEIMGLSEENDLALLRVPDLGLTPVEFESEATLGAPVWVVAFPWGRRRTVVSGAVSQIAWGGKAVASVPLQGPVELVDAPVSYGMSGGGVYDADSGKLLGIVRGYRSAELSLPGSDSAVLKIPVAGETTVIAAPAIIGFLRAQGLERLIPAE